MKIFLTGSSGYIGKNFLKFAVKKNIKITCAYRKKKPNLKSSNIEILKFNIFKNKKIFKRKIDLLLHLAWEKKNYLPSNDLNEAKKHLKFLKSVIDSGANNIVVAGSCFEYGKKNGSLNEKTSCDPKTNYGIQKKYILDNLLRYQKIKKFNLTWLRIFYVFGEDQPSNTLYGSFIKAQKKNQEFNMSKGNQSRDYIHINDLIKIIYKIIKSKKKNLGIINVCSGKSIKINTLVKSWNFDNKILINRGFYDYPKYEGFNFWGSIKKLKKIIKWN